MNRADDRYLSTPNPSFRGWTRPKWILILGYTVIFVFAVTALVASMMTWFRAYLRAEVFVTGNKTILVITTVTSIMTVVNCLMAFCGILMNNRKLLTVCAFILWPLFAMTASVGYLGYKRLLWNLRAKLGSQWRSFSYNERLTIQNNLHCCGFQGPLDHPAVSNKCYMRSLLPGCLGKYYRFNSQSLNIAYVVSFSLLLPHLLLIFAAVLFSNHIDDKWNRDPPPACK
ncbi:hypothetical protein K493DRAFT_243177 [Basidiobolus meristosporus CBS 931.73]|uniref:Tetraspanin Tsp2 n=1 Tax=Basidiobolus meristosporus CBS 931.73 TaxID=1314790 RepID=A0A1Y1X2C9_9FUNG|nr:hypothetical protein K493DRAFT_243177 [Basidiobolus meristosporus CBS 931.73]|eukprot:ORX79950.1 hypothetical protein K493DRAFT_243177 [Basidiobolus meristosporus CBS 931.73]